MKKLLALVLALVMSMSLVTISNAAFKDADKIDYKEAVDVMNAVGVFIGDEKGNFNAKENLTREQAAKLIAYLDLGESAAEALPGVKVFSDVEATRWSAKYIAYCADAGYIAGDGTGKFNPAGELNGYAFGKMLLCVLGYDADIEGFVGNNWSINVAKLMESNDIADGVSGAASATLTREQAAQYCLNALKADMVEYDTKGTSIEINGAKIATGASKATAVKDSTDVAKHNVIGKENSGAADNTVTTVQLGEKLYDGDLKLTKGTGTSFKAPAVKWTYKNSEVDTYADAPTATYTGKVTKGTIYTLLGKDIVDDLNKENAVMLLAIDGRYQTNDTGTLAATNDGSVDNIGKNYIVKNSSAAAFGTDRGMTTEVYVDDDGATGGYALIRVIVKNTYVMKATADYNAKTEKLSVTDLSNKAGSGSLKAEDFAVEGFKKDDYILYTAADEGSYTNSQWHASWKVQTIEKAPVVSGKVDSFALKDSVTLDGTKYNYSTTLDKTNADHGRAIAFAIGDTATVVLDGQNNIIYVDEAKASNDDVVFVKSVAKNGFDFIAKIVTVDGKKLTVTLDEDSYVSTSTEKIGTSNVTVANGGTNTGNGDDARSKLFDGKFWAYEVNGNEYELTPYTKQGAKNATNGAITLNKVTTLDTGKTANSSTLYIIEDEDGDINLYTGVKNAPKTVTVGAGGKVYYVHNSSNEVVYVYAKGEITSADSSNDQMIYVVKGNGDTVYTDANKNHYVEAKALVDGAETTLKIKCSTTAANSASVTAEAGKLYKSMTVDSDGYVTKLGDVSTGTTNKYDALTMTTEYDAFDYSDDVFTADTEKVNGADADTYSKFVKTDSVYVVLFKNIDNKVNKNAALMDDDNADYEIVEVRDFEALENFVKGYTITGTGYVLLSEASNDTDAELIGAYIGITASSEYTPVVTNP